MRKALFLCALLVSVRAGAAIPASERSALESFYQATNGAGWKDKTGWLGPAGTECDWYGVECDETQSNVAGLFLYDNQLDGQVPSSIRNLTKLRHLQIWNGNLRGSLPAEIGELSNLETFHADRNRFTGPIPSAFGGLTKLRMLWLSGNQLTGPLPSTLNTMVALEEINLGENLIDGSIPNLSGLSNLKSLGLVGNRLSGGIPASLGSLAKLEHLDLLGNPLGGTIPPELGNLPALIYLRLAYCQLTGPIPPAFGRLRALETLDLVSNQLSGAIPAEAGDMQALKELLLESNQLTGTIPASVFGLRNLERLGLGANLLTGTISPQVASLTSLKVLSLYANKLEGPIPVEVTTLAQLTSLELQGNDLTGTIPVELSRLTNLTYIDLSGNALTGTIPRELASLKQLEALYLYENWLEGLIPPELGQLSKLRIFSVAANKLRGGIPDALRNLTNLEQFYVNGNQLTGSIPFWIGEWTKLTDLFLSYNQFTGTLPAGLATLSNLTYLDIGDNQLSGRLIEFDRMTKLLYVTVQFNQFSGPLPASLFQLQQLNYMAFSNNKFSGPLPPEIGNLTNVELLSLNDNSLEGPIPKEIGKLQKAYYIGLWGNHLSGAIPKELGDLTALQFLDLSFNALRGPIPSEITKMTGLENARSDFSSNALYTNDPAVRAFVNQKQYDGDFEAMQTVLPTQILVASTTDRSATLSWEPIRFEYYGGGYQVIASTTPNGPPVTVQTTPNKSARTITVRNLQPSTGYFFTVTSISHPSGGQKNVVLSERSAPVQASTTARVLAPADVVMTDTPDGMVQIDRVEVETDSFTLTNFGDVATSLTLERSEDFFTISPTQFSLGPGATQKIEIRSQPRAAGTYYGYVSIDGDGTAEDLYAEIVLLSSDRPSGSVVATPLATRVELAGSPGSDQVGTVQFRNSGTARLTGILLSDQPWVVVEKEPINIDPGTVVTVNFTIRRSRRPEGTEGALVANLSLVYVSGGSSSGSVSTHDTSSVSTSKVTIVDVTKPPVSVGALPPLAPGEVPFYVPGIAVSTGTQSDLSIINATGAGIINDLKLYFTSGAQTSVATMQPLGFAQAVNLTNVANTVYGSTSAVGTMQIRSGGWSNLFSESKVTTVNSTGTYSGSIPVFRGDRSVSSSGRLYLTGLSSPGDLYLQETGGVSGTLSIEFRNAAGGNVGTLTPLIGAGALLELKNAVPANAVTAIVRYAGSGQITGYARLSNASGDTWSVVDWSRFYGFDADGPMRVPFANGQEPGGKRRSVRSSATTARSQTDVSIFNPGSVEERATLQVVESGGRVTEKSITVPAGATLKLTDVAATAGTTVAHVVVIPDRSDLFVSARSYSATGGSAVPVLAAGAGLRLGQAQVFPALSDSVATRTSFGLSESSGATVKVRVRIIIDETSPLTSTVTSKTFTLGPGQQVFEAELLRSFAGDARNTLFGDLHNLRLEFEVIEGEGSVVPFIIATDAASGDSNVIVQ